MQFFDFVTLLVIVSVYMAVAHQGMRGVIPFGMIWTLPCLALAVINLAQSWDRATPEQNAAAFLLFIFEFMLVMRAGYVRFVEPVED